ncbi:class I SAM-dependent methyltransferase [Corynebacterium hylobatis]|uniref:Class I SAM-dependent methyltransferase n=1 Tax=Corynebacterium hylobatis TaxID=1859290 RepID=A0A3R9ZYA1_9CORY|nr:class I SAM-dependent methyltransferase [Corynebacterium hylobatis]RSZ61455.1 class I SAM-dependent methyltransferase [Corynebacterium hylobatis]
MGEHQDDPGDLLPLRQGDRPLGPHPLRLRTHGEALSSTNWSHNDHFHGWVLRSLPDARSHALDLGCGSGRLVRQLASCFETVTGVDSDPRIIQGVEVPVNARLFASDALAVQERADLITMIAVLHHLPLRSALEHVADLLNPGGRFLCVGLARPRNLVDWVWEAGNVVANPLIGLLKYEKATPSPARIAAPSLTLEEIDQVGSEVMPGLRIRRREGFRHTLMWSKP